MIQDIITMVSSNSVLVVAALAAFAALKYSATLQAEARDQADVVVKYAAIVGSGFYVGRALGSSPSAWLSTILQVMPYV